MSAAPSCSAGFVVRRADLALLHSARCRLLGTAQTPSLSWPPPAPCFATAYLTAHPRLTASADFCHSLPPPRAPPPPLTSLHHITPCLANTERPAYNLWKLD